MVFYRFHSNSPHFSLYICKNTLHQLCDETYIFHLLNYLQILYELSSETTFFSLAEIILHFPPVGTARTFPQTRHLTTEVALPKIICSFLHDLHLTFKNFPAMPHHFCLYFTNVSGIVLSRLTSIRSQCL